MATIKTRQNSKATVLDISGKLDSATGAPELRSAVRGALNDGARHILLNMAEVSDADDAGIKELVNSSTSAGQLDVTVKLLKPTPQLRALLSSAQLAAPFEIFEDEEAAIASFS